MIPVYPATARVTTWEIARAVRVILDTLPELDDPILEDVRRKRGLVDLRTALIGIHRPATLRDADAARERLTFEEALVLQAAVVRRRAAMDRWSATPRRGSGEGILARFDAALPFDLTPGQRAVGHDVAADLARPRPMQRLLQGDVGSGKTVVALRAMLDVVDSGGQAALLAPTEVLAFQHARTIRELLGPLAAADTLDVADLGASGTRVSVLTGSLKGRARTEALHDIADGTAGIVIGTHALLEESVDFADLGLVVIDEQHRFGVEQRARLGERVREGRRPHILVMTATPIPRTVVMTVFGDLDVSTLTDVPEGRARVATHVVDPETQPTHYERVWKRVIEEAAEGHRIFVVCARIGEGLDVASDEDSGVHGVLEFASSLTALCPGLRIGTLHGRMSAEEKDDVMSRFRGPGEHALDVLVATTVIEVGVDVPQASMMVVMDAERFGISQLHQLRGRIGRGAIPGVCILVSNAEGIGRTRLDAVAGTRDGFILAQQDLELRGAGDVLGVAQSGLRSSLRLLDVLNDVDVIRDARAVAEAVIHADPDLAQHPTLRAALDHPDSDRLTFLERA